MSSFQSGQRIELSEGASGIFHFAGNDTRIAVAAIAANGAITPLSRHSLGAWHLPAFADPGEHYEVVAYITDDRDGGFVNPCYPLDLEINGQRYSRPKPAQSLAAVILAGVYAKSGKLRLKVSNEGFTFGADAYLRARNLGHLQLPRRSSSSQPDEVRDHNSRPRRPSGTPGSALASGSGVIVGHNLVVTNAHVVEAGRSFQLGRTHNPLTLIAVDEDHDLALLQGDVGGTPLPIRLTTPIWLGESIMASGYPLMDLLGADLKVTTGNVSGLSGKAGDISRFQFTAPIASGSSGGAVIDDFGNLVGITSASLAHENMRERGSISENVNFGIRASLVFEMVAATGKPLPSIGPLGSGTRREVVDRLRESVVSIIVLA